MTKKTKHEFVDDNPYLVYSGDIDTSYNGDSGSGGGDGGGGGGGDVGDNGIFVVHITGAEVAGWSTVGTSNFNVTESIDDIVEAFLSGKKVIAIQVPRTSVPITDTLYQFDLNNVDIDSENDANNPVYNMFFSSVVYTSLETGDVIEGSVYTINATNLGGNDIFTGKGARFSIRPSL